MKLTDKEIDTLQRLVLAHMGQAEKHFIKADEHIRKAQEHTSVSADIAEKLKDRLQEDNKPLLTLVDNETT